MVTWSSGCTAGIVIVRFDEKASHE
jgi:hypothetical protein